MTRSARSNRASCLAPCACGQFAAARPRVVTTRSRSSWKATCTPSRFPNASICARNSISKPGRWTSASSRLAARIKAPENKRQHLEINSPVRALSPGVAIDGKSRVLIMNPELIKYYSQELQHVREMGGEFAKAYPKVAARLGLESFECADPMWSVCWKASASCPRAYR